MNIKLSYGLFCKNIIANIIFILQITISIILVNVMIGNINRSLFTVHQFRPFTQVRGLYYMPINAQELDNESRINELHNQLMEETGISTIDQYFLRDNERSYILYAYDNIALSLFTPDMREGEWLNNNNSDDTIPVVTSHAGGKLQLGQTLRMNIDGGDESADFKIVGIMQEPVFYLNYCTESNVIATDHLYSYFNIKFYQYPMIFASKHDIEKFSEYIIDTNIASVILFNESIDDQTMQENIDYLSKSGDISDLNNIYIRGNENAVNMIRSYSPYFICGFLLSFVGLIGLTVLSTANSLRSFAIFYLLGCRWKNCVKICLGYVLVMLFMSFVLLGSIYAFAEMRYSLASLGIVINKYNVLVSFGIYLFTALISYIVLKISFHRKPAIRILAEHIEA
jgi:hypothetical protein